MNGFYLFCKDITHLKGWLDTTVRYKISTSTPNPDIYICKYIYTITFYMHIYRMYIHAFTSTYHLQIYNCNNIYATTYPHLHVCIAFEFMQINVHMSTYTAIPTRTFSQIYLHIYTYTSIPPSASFASTSTHLHAHIFFCKHLWACIYISVARHLNLQLHLCTYIYTHLYYACKLKNLP